jgi:hypothetical protein
MPLPIPFYSSEAVTAEDSPAGSSNAGRRCFSLLRYDECEHLKNQRLRVLIHIVLKFLHAVGTECDSVFTLWCVVVIFIL